MFSRGEVSQCPECGVAVRPLAELPPSAEAEALEPAPQVPPEEEILGWGYAGRGRGPLVVVALMGIGVFVFAPWLHESAPEIRQLTGFQFARMLPWLWACGVGWVVMLALVVSRRTILHMRGARLAVGLMALMVLSSVALRLALPIPAQRLLPRRFHWGWGMYSAGFLSLIALFYAWKFGGNLSDMPSAEKRQGDETLH
jgi:magnesium-transporting ATPase (P-type)